MVFFTQQNNNPASGKPKAYLKVLFFDERMKFDADASGYIQVGTGTMTPGNPGQIGFMAGSARLAKKSGYCYIYISNESDELVYFDNLTLSHEHSSLMEETHYYPFGLVMAGISSRASGAIENRKKFNGIEQTTDLEVNTYDALFRTADPQIGRWWQVDPKPNVFESPYSMMGGNPISKHDFYGDTPRVIAPIIINQKTMPNVYKNHLNYLKKHPNEAIRFGDLTMIVFDYEPDKRQQEKNRRENKRANPINNSDPSKQEDEVAPASTKQGGARGVRMAVPAEENASHGGQIGAAIKWLNMGEGDMFLTVLIPGTSNDGEGASIPSNVPNFSAARTSAKQVATSRSPNQPSPANSSSLPLLRLLRMNVVGAAIQAAMNTIMIESMSQGQKADSQIQ